MWGPPGGPDPASGGPSNEWTGPPIPGGPSGNEWTAPPPASGGGPSNEWTGPSGNEWSAPPPASGGGPSNEWTGPSGNEWTAPGGPSNEWSGPGGPRNEWTGPPIPASGGSVYGGQPPYGFRPTTAFPPPAPPSRLEGYGPGPPPPPHMAGHGGYGFDPALPPPSFNRPPPPHGPPFPPMLNQAQRSLHGGPPCSDLRPPPLAAPPPPSSSGPWFEDVHNNNNPGAGSTSSQRFHHQQQRQAESCGFGPQSVQSLPSRDSLRQHAHRDVPERAGGGGGPLLDSPAFPPDAWIRGDVQNQSFMKAPQTQPPPDEDAVQRRQDEQWLRRFLQSRGRTSKTPASGKEEEEKEKEEEEQPSRSSNEVSVPLMQSELYGAAGLVSELSLACEALRRDLENSDEESVSVWADAYAAALRLKGELRDKMAAVVSDDDGGGPGGRGRRRLDALKSKLSRVARKRAWQRRRKLRQREEKRLEEERVAEKEAEIDKWRLKKIVEVEEKKRELELKLATDSVLSEVLKKQADVKRMLDILRSLEKLRKLRKEAASRKGIFPEPEADQVFDQQLETLRALIRKRTAVYGAEENMLRVMLEGEQEEERKKDLERRQRKERERRLQKKRDMEAMLFGDEMPADHLLQPFREYYTQAEHSLPALVQRRREWDVFLVAVDHPDGTPIPQGWVLPEAPSDWAWASALEQ